MDPHEIVAYIVGLIVAIGLGIAIFVVWLRQRASERNALDRETQTTALVLKKINKLVARQTALEYEYRRQCLVTEVIREYGPSRGDAE